ncbi:MULTISPECIES: glucose PTS transporter transcription antiterminator GlcT [Pontibacillus]|uniref:PRD domain-containing protein n=1 Tax=Pontibacillus chungwhensis TaxID=265426 RepID=A0ABY8UYC7_9BACI|nr:MULTISPECIES: PRD domain-containing protein [Pontibacillus]MCD5325552.1 PRD domain-containing protein [Pontibacillus sp. HN14]WIF98661.1 PRD domain-containing protein [Pontibacillus chungwhensis]
MPASARVKRVLNNNVVIAIHPVHEEVILIGKGIGFGKKNGEALDVNEVEKTFLLEDKVMQENYKQLLPYVGEEFIGFMDDLLSHIEYRMNSTLNEHIHIALTDHLSFAIKRMKEGLEFNNPFLIEVQTLYPKEHEVALEVVDMIESRLGFKFPVGEVGFIAMHIHSAITDKEISQISRDSELIKQLTQLIEDELSIDLDRQSIDFHRLVQHLRRAIDRVYKGEEVGERTKLDDLLKSEYPVCYNLAWKLIKIMQQKLKQPIDDAEIVYLTIHLQRLQSS